MTHCGHDRNLSGWRVSRGSRREAGEQAWVAAHLQAAAQHGGQQAGWRLPTGEQAQPGGRIGGHLQVRATVQAVGDGQGLPADRDGQRTLLHAGEDQVVHRVQPGGGAALEQQGQAGDEPVEGARADAELNAFHTLCGKRCGT
jgi:hypothetical protein